MYRSFSPSCCGLPESLVVQISLCLHIILVVYSFATVANNIRSSHVVILWAVFCKALHLLFLGFISKNVEAVYSLRMSLQMRYKGGIKSFRGACCLMSSENFREYPTNHKHPHFTNNMPDNNTATVKFNVGGRAFEVSRSLLDKYSDTVLGRTV
jgi:hypothetical protein